MTEKMAILALNGILKGDANTYLEILDEDNKLIIGADGGALLLEKIGLIPDIIIGDLDSLSPEKVAEFQSKGVTIRQYPVEKDETDGELALEYCVDNGISMVQIIGASGGRFDQQLANLFLLEYALKRGLRAFVKEPGLEIGLIDKTHHFNNQQGNSLSLLPLTGEVKGVSITGCKYPLTGQDLQRFKSRGVSNIITAEQARVQLEQGLLVYLLFNEL